MLFQNEINKTKTNISVASDFVNFDHSYGSNHSVTRKNNMVYLMTQLGNLENARAKIIKHENSLQVAFIYREATQKIWDDRESGAHRDGSFYTIDPTHITASSPDNKLYKDFKLLGDRACSQHSKCGPLILVSDISNAPYGYEALKRPKSAHPVWKDNGSGAAEDVTIWKLDPPDPLPASTLFYSGRFYDMPETRWRCLGDVATNGHDSYPDLNKYRCVIEDAIDFDSTFLWGHLYYPYKTNLLANQKLNK